MFIRTIIFIIGLIFSYTASSREIKEEIHQVSVVGEKVVLKLPQSFILSDKTIIESTATNVFEYLSSNETVNDWATLITVEFFENEFIDPLTYFNKEYEKLTTECPLISSDQASTGFQFNIPILHGSIYCNQKNNSNSGEAVYYAIARGVTGLHVVRWIFKSEPFESKNIVIDKTKLELFKEFWKTPRLCLETDKKKTACLPL